MVRPAHWMSSCRDMVISGSLGCHPCPREVTLFNPRSSAMDSMIRMAFTRLKALPLLLVSEPFLRKSTHQQHYSRAVLNPPQHFSLIPECDVKNILWCGVSVHYSRRWLQHGVIKVRRVVVSSVFLPFFIPLRSRSFFLDFLLPFFRKCLDSIKYRAYRTTLQTRHT